MGGLEKITEHIIRDAEAQAEKIIGEAKQAAEKKSAQNRELLEKRKLEAEERAKQQSDRVIQLGQGNDKLEQRRIMLEAKSKIIKGIISEAHDTMLSSPDYPEMLKTLIRNSISDKEGEVIFSQRDKDIANADFKEYVSTISDGKLTISSNTTDIPNGFIVKYGKIEINCSIDSIFEEKYSYLTDIVNSSITAE